MNTLTRGGLPDVDLEPQAVYLDLPASNARWRLAQIHGAGVHPESVTFDAGRMKLGPFTPEEYAAAWAVLDGNATRLHNTGRRVGNATFAILFVAVAGVALGWLALPALGLLLLLAPVGILAGLALVVTSATKRARLGRLHPDRGKAMAARLTWWIPALGWLIALAVALAMLAMLAMAGGLL